MINQYYYINYYYLPTLINNNTILIIKCVIKGFITYYLGIYHFGNECLKNVLIVLSRRPHFS